MRNLSKNLMTLWLAVTLVLMPLQAMTADIAGAANAAPPCAMPMDAGVDSQLGAHEAHGVNQESADSHCQACSDHSCQQGGECSGQSCVSCLVQAAAISGIHLNDSNPSDPAVSLQPTLVISRTEPPPLRPPV